MVTLCPFIFSSNLQPMALALVFILINATAVKSNALKSIHAINRKTYGTVYFPLAFLLLVAFWWEKPITLVLSMMVLTFSDTFASYMGKHKKNILKYRLWYDEKSFQGSAAMFLSAAMIIYTGTDFFLWLFHASFFIPLDVLVGCAVFTGGIATIGEAISREGSDNLSIPLVTAVSYDLYLIEYTHGRLPLLVIWTLGSGLIFYLAYKYRSLTVDGAVTAMIMGIFIFGAGGWPWIAPMVVFFILSSILSKIGKKSQGTHQKGSNRDWAQVMANGVVPMIICLINFYYPFNHAYIFYLGAIAAATADTWATEIGSFSCTIPRHILNLNPVEKGTSGGVTLLGFLGSLLGASTISFVGSFWMSSEVLPESKLVAMVGIIAAGFIGSLVDSILGGSAQAMFRCAICNKETEKRIHCSVHTDHIYGFKWLDNDGVNFINTIIGAAMADIIFC